MIAMLFNLSKLISKFFIFFVFICTASVKAQDSRASLSLLDKGLLQLALDDAQISPEKILSIVAETINLCTSAINRSKRSQEIIEIISQSLNIECLSPISKTAQNLTDLILENPSTLQVLYAMTQITIATIQSDPQKTALENATYVVLWVKNALEPFIKQKKKKILIFWFWISIGIAACITGGSLLYQYITHHAAQPEAQLVKVKKELAQLNERYVELHNQIKKQTIQPSSTHKESNKTAEKLSKKIIELEKTTHALKQEHNLGDKKYQQEFKTIKKELKDVTNQMQNIDAASRNHIAQVAQSNVRGMKIVQQRLAAQEKQLNESIELIINQINESLDEPLETSDGLSISNVQELTQWIRTATDLAKTLKSFSEEKIPNFPLHGKTKKAFC